MSERVLFSAQKNEGPFLLEWVAYHLVIGFTRIVVVSNDCDDGGDVLLDKLHAAGVLRHLRQEVPKGMAPQARAEEIARAAGSFGPGDWVMWLDLDEFLIPAPPHRTVGDMIGAAGDAAAIMVAWRFFGDSGHKVWPGRHVSPDFTRAAIRRRGRSGQVKTLFRYGPEVARLDIHRPVLAPGVDAAAYPAITSAGTPVDPQFYEPRARPFNRLVEQRRPYVLGQVAHFSIRTPDMYARKARRGDGYYANPEAVPRDDDLYRKRNFNDVPETGLAERAPETGAKMTELMELPGVAAAARAIPGFRMA